MSYSHKSLALLLSVALHCAAPIYAFAAPAPAPSTEPISGEIELSKTEKQEIEERAHTCNVSPTPAQCYQVAMLETREKATEAFTRAYEKIQPDLRDLIWHTSLFKTAPDGSSTGTPPCEDATDAVLQAICLEPVLSDLAKSKRLPEYNHTELKDAATAMLAARKLMIEHGVLRALCIKKTGDMSTRSCLSNGKFPNHKHAAYRFLPDHKSPYYLPPAPPRTEEGLKPLSNDDKGHLPLFECVKKTFPDASPNEMRGSDTCKLLGGSDLANFSYEIRSALIYTDIKSYFDLLRIEGVSRTLSSYREITGLSDAPWVRECSSLTTGFHKFAQQPNSEQDLKAQQQWAADTLRKRYPAYRQAAQAMIDAYKRIDQLRSKSDGAVVCNYALNPLHEKASSPEERAQVLASIKACQSDARIQSQLAAELTQSKFLEIDSIFSAFPVLRSAKPSEVLAARSADDFFALARMSVSRLKDTTERQLKSFCAKDPAKGGLSDEQMAALTQLKDAVEQRYSNPVFDGIHFCLKDLKLHKEALEPALQAGVMLGCMVIGSFTPPLGEFCMSSTLIGGAGAAVGSAMDSKSRLTWIQTCYESGSKTCDLKDYQTALQEFDGAVWTAILQGAVAAPEIPKFKTHLAWIKGSSSPDMLRAFAKKLGDPGGDKALARELEATEKNLATQTAPTSASAKDPLAPSATLALPLEAEKIAGKLLKSGKTQEASWALRDAGFVSQAEVLETRTADFLKTAPIKSIKKLGGGVSTSLLVEFEDGTRAVFKPEQKSWAANHRYEVGAYQADKVLGTHLVPVTVERTIGGKVGSLQYFVKNAKSGYFVTVNSDMILLDQMIGNPDRHGGNYMILKDGSGRQVAIDHGLAFQSLGPYEYLKDVKKIVPTREVYQRLRSIKPAALDQALKGWVTPPEVDYVKQRLATLLKNVDSMIAQEGEASFYAKP